MPSPRALKRLDALIWALIYGGLFALILGVASHDETVVGGWSLSVLGGLATVAGVVLIFVRSRMRDTPPPGAQSGQQKQENKT